MSDLKERAKLKKIRKILAKQGIAYDGSRFTFDANLDLKKYVNSELFGKPSKRKR